MADRDHPNIVHESEVEWRDGEPIVRGDDRNLGYKRKRLATAAGSENLGCSVYELQPGQRPFVPHYHLSNEEAIYVLDGAGTIQVADAEIDIAEGDYIVLPSGKEHVRQVINDSNEPLRYLCFSTMIDPEISILPESGQAILFTDTKFGSEQQWTAFEYSPQTDERERT